MSLLRQALSTITMALPAEKAYAHCDIPCGIYDPITAKIAAQTVQKMVMRIQALQQPGASDSAEAWATYENTLGRYVAVKEELRKCVGVERPLAGALLTETPLPAPVNGCGRGVDEGTTAEAELQQAA